MIADIVRLLHYVIGWLACLLATYHAAASVDGNVTLLKGTLGSGKDAILVEYHLIQSWFQ